MHHGKSLTSRERLSLKLRFRPPLQRSIVLQTERRNIASNERNERLRKFSYQGTRCISASHICSELTCNRFHRIAFAEFRSLFSFKFDTLHGRHDTRASLRASARIERPISAAASSNSLRPAGRAFPLSSVVRYSVNTSRYPY